MSNLNWNFPNSSFFVTLFNVPNIGKDQKVIKTMV